MFERAERITNMEEVNDINILIAGDFAPCRSIEDAYNSGKRNFYDSHILELLHNKDLSLVNLELPLTRVDTPIPKVGPNIKARHELIELVTEARFDIACLANNHIYDHGEQGLQDTLDVCEKNGIITVGAGSTLAEAQRILYRTVKSRTVAVVNFAENEFCNASLKQGGANPMDLIDNVHQIQDARRNAEIVLVIVHGGHEHYHYPSPRMVKQYRYYVENGADAVVSHHTHCIGPYEIYEGKPIIYSFYFFPGRDTHSQCEQEFVIS